MSKGVSRFWREIPARYNLIGKKCKKCGFLAFPPRETCLKCMSIDMDDYDFKGTGEIVSYTITHVAQEGFEKQTPYIIAIVKLDEGPSLTAQIVDCNPSDVAIGKKVYSVFRRISEDGKAGAIYYGYKFRLSE